jgi:hypothetical protein
VALFGQNAVGGLHGDARAGSKINSPLHRAMF